MSDQPDMVNHLTREQFVGFLIGQVAKYLWRAGKKGDLVEDLHKAGWYLDRLIATVREGSDGV